MGCISPRSWPYDEDPELVRLRDALDRRIGEAQLPEINLGVDVGARLSRIMLGGKPRSASEPLCSAPASSRMARHCPLRRARA